MRVSHDEGMASHVGPESCGGDREATVEALTGEGVGWVSSREKAKVRSADDVRPSEGNTGRVARQRQTRRAPRGLQTPGTHRSISRGSREIPGPARPKSSGLARAVNPKGVRR